MKIILTSQVFSDDDATNKTLNQINKDVSILKVLLIATPCLPYGPEKYLNELLEYGIKNENIIIYNHEEPKKYCDLDIDIIYVTGGNTFIGLKLIKDSGFDKEIVKYIDNDVTYIGRSAGAHIVTNDVEHVLEFDSNDIGTTDYEGLGLVDCILVCHYSDKRKDCYQKLIDENKYTVYSLTNQEILVYDGIEIKKL